LIKHDLLQNPMLAAPTSLPEMIMQTLQSGIAKTCFPASAPPANETIFSAIPLPSIMQGDGLSRNNLVA
jgi:hypothetical protein